MTEIVELVMILQVWQKRDDTGDSAKAIDLLVAIQKNVDSLESQLRAAEKRANNYYSRLLTVKRGVEGIE